MVRARVSSACALRKGARVNCPLSCVRLGPKGVVLRTARLLSDPLTLPPLLLDVVDHDGLGRAV